MFKVLGKSKLKVMAVGLGTGYIFDSKLDKSAIVRVLRKGIELGMNLIDTAENYGDGRSEIIVGKAIKGVRGKVIVASKFAVEHSGKREILRAVDGSLRRLKTDYIDLYQFHWTNPSIGLDETLQALEHLIKVGKIRFVGLGNFSKNEIVYCKKVLKNKVVSLQTEYNLFERSIEQNGILNYCQKVNLPVIAYSPLDQGRVNLMNLAQKNLMKSLSKKYGKTTAQIMLRWLVGNPVVVAVPRTRKIKHLIENYQSMNFNLEKGDFEKINKLFFMELVHVPIKEIRVSKHGEWGHPVYKSKDEALSNKLGFIPSPLELSEQIKKGGFLKPVRLIKLRGKSGKYGYDLIGGRIRYWAWVIAYGNKKPISVYIRN